MVTGSGLQNRDEEFFEHKPFAVIADALARQGIATLRYDDRGFGESTGDVTTITTEDLKKDALAGVELLRKQFDRVGILGHSEGGTIGLMLAAEDKVDFVVSLAGMATSGEKTLLVQNRWMLQQAGYSEDVTDLYCKTLESLFDELKTGAEPPNSESTEQHTLYALFPGAGHDRPFGKNHMPRAGTERHERPSGGLRRKSEHSPPRAGRTEGNQSHRGSQPPIPAL